MDLIELSLRDPDYIHLDKLLATAKGYLSPCGLMIISFSLQMGNTKKMEELINKYGWSYSLLVER